MNSWQLRDAVWGTIKKKLTHKRSFLGISDLPSVSMSNGGDICAITHNE